MIAEGDNAAEDDEAPNLQAAAFAPTGAAHPVEPAPTPISPASAKAPAAQELETPAELGWVKSRRRHRGAGRAAAARPAEAGAGADAGDEAARRRSRGASHGVRRSDDRRARSGPSRGETATTAAARAGWMIQIGATDDAAKANALLIRARERNRSTLAAAKPVTEKVRKGEDTFYRARFAGLDSASAETACRSLKRNGFSCFAARD